MSRCGKGEGRGWECEHTLPCPFHPVKVDPRDTRIEQLTILVNDALKYLETARPALKWVRNHAPRHDEHDQEHAQIALDQVLAAIEVLRSA